MSGNITILNSVRLDSLEIANEWIRILGNTLDDLTRPVVIGDNDQNVLVTDDGYYIENFTFENGKYPADDFQHEGPRSRAAPGAG